MNPDGTTRFRSTLILLTVLLLTLAFLGAMAGVTILVRAQEPPGPEPSSLVGILGAGPVHEGNSSVTAAPDELRGDGNSIITLTARARNASNDPVFDAFVGFSTTLGSTNFPQAEAESSDVVTNPQSAWTQVADGSASGGAIMQTNGATDPNAQASWTFNIPSSADGRGAVSVRYRIGANNAIAQVEVDGSSVMTIDMSGAAGFDETVVTTGLSAGSHTVVVKHTSPPSTNGGGLFLEPDLFRSGATTASSGPDAGNASGTLTSVNFCCGSSQVTVTATFIGSFVTKTTNITMVASEPFTSNSSVQTAAPFDVNSSGNQVTATIKDFFDKNVLPTTVVSFTVGGSGGGGSIQVSNTTSSGVASVVYTAPTTTGGPNDSEDVVITATAFRSDNAQTPAGGADIARVTTTVDIVAGPPATITVSSSASRISAATDSTANTVVITAVVSDTYSNLVENGTVVTFTTSETAGVFAYLTRSTSSGLVTNIYTPTIAAVVSLTHTITATADSVVGTTTIEVEPGDPFTDTSDITFTSISSTSESRPRANLSDLIVVTATFRDANNNIVNKPNDVVTLTVANNVGTWGSSGGPTTTVKTLITQGVVITDLIAGSITGTQVITAQLSDPVRVTTEITFIEPAQNITLTQSKTSIRATGADEAIVTATVVDADGNPAPSQRVTFTVSAGTFIDGQGPAITIDKLTNDSGVATATITATLKGTSQITGTTLSVTGHQVTDVVTITVPSGDPLTVTIFPDPVELTAELTSTVNAVVSDTFNNVVPNEPVTFTLSTSPQLAAFANGNTGTTDENGVVTITLVGVEAGSASGAITATTSNGVTGTANISTVAGTPTTLTLSTQYDTIAVVGGVTPPTSTIVTATVVDSESNPVNGKLLTFTLTTNQGSWDSDTTTRESTVTATTNPSGVATQTLYGWNVPSTATIRVIDGSVTETIQVVVAGNPNVVSLSANPASIEVGGNTSTLSAIVKDAFEHLVVDGMSIAFTTSDGTVSSPGTTTDGVASAVLTSSNTAGSVVVTATTPNGINGTTTVTFDPGSLDSFTFEAFAAPRVGVPFSVTLRAKDRFDNDKTDFTGTVALGCSGCTVSPTSVTFGAGDNGVKTFNATVTGSAGPGKALTAIDGGKSGISSVFTLNPGPPANVDLTVSQAIQTVNQTIDLTADVTDGSGNDVEDGTVVTFTTTAGQLGSLTITKTTTNGQATAVLTGPATPQVVTVTATADSVSDSETVTFGEPDIGVIKEFGAPQFFYAYDAPATTGGASTLLADDAGGKCISNNDNIVAMAAGDFDGDGEVEVAVVKLFGSSQFLYIYNLPATKNGTCTLEASETTTKVVTSNNNVAFMAAGDFDTSDAAEELAVIKTFGALQFFYIYDPPTTVGGTGTLIASETPPFNPTGDKTIASNDNVSFMAGGNFDADAQHEVAVVKTFGASQFFYIYDVPTTTGGTGTLIASETPPGVKKITSNNNIDVMAAGNFDGDATDEVAVIKKFGVSQFFYIYDVPATVGGTGTLIASDLTVLPSNNNVKFMAGLK